MNLNQPLSKTDLLLIAIVLPVMIAYTDTIKTALVWTALIGFPLSALFYLLRWYLDR